jgi:hypothetical protein
MIKATGNFYRIFRSFVLILSVEELPILFHHTSTQANRNGMLMLAKLAVLCNIAMQEMFLH